MSLSTIIKVIFDLIFATCRRGTSQRCLSFENLVNLQMSEMTIDDFPTGLVELILRPRAERSSQMSLVAGHLVATQQSHRYLSTCEVADCQFADAAANSGRPC